MLLVFKQPLHIFLLWIQFSSLTYSASVSLEQPAHRQDQPQGLYNATDAVEELTGNNFSNKIYGSNRSWLVEFYNTWCGHCQRFAPTYKTVADYFKDSKDVFIVAAVDCANEINQPLCRDFEIMSYPTLRYFHENFVEGSGNLGLTVTKGDVDNVSVNIKVVVKTLQSEQKSNRAQMLPPLLPYEHTDISEIFDTVKQEVEFAFLLLEADDTLLGVQAALTFHKISKIFITYSEKTNVELSRSLNIDQFPALIILSRSAQKPKIEERIQKIDDVKKHISDFLKLKNINVDQYLNHNNKEIKNDPMENNLKVPDLMDRVKKMGDVVFQMDLETALRFSLGMEVSRTKVIEGDKLDALRAYLKVLVKYFPLGRKGRAFLNHLNTTLSNTNSIRGAEISLLMKNSEKQDRLIWSSPKEWLGCKGSTPATRGYPCGIWKMFHYLTVNAVDQNIGKKNIDPKEVLMAMHGYIKQFFGCSDCSQHFQKMAVERKIEQVSSLNGAVIWLWAAHNEVNGRLAGDITEDPEYPKRQFPVIERCPLCRYNNGSWNTDEVGRYIKHMYSSINIRYIGSDTKILHMGLEDSSYDSNAVLDSFDSICRWLLLIPLYLGYIHARH